MDNFQGEESNIILLSLVRSNVEGKVGFLRTENRVCVALSRAKHGLFIAGNMDQLKQSSELWKSVDTDLIQSNSLGRTLMLKCENHPDEPISVTTGADILNKSPEGGCTKRCPHHLPVCGHVCPQICHMSDREHKKVKCPVPCPKVLCERNHPCPLKCGDQCEPCMVSVPKTLPCGHTHQVRCHAYNRRVLCPTIVERELPDCKHRTKMQCHRNPQDVPCPFPCDIRLDCGHKCSRKCHVKDDPDHVDYKCKQPCTRSPHKCSQDHKCKKDCYEDCGPCRIEVNKKALCGHVHNVQCCVPREEIICKSKCKKSLPCGHHCPKRCFEECGGCMVKVKKVVPECLHEVQVILEIQFSVWQRQSLSTYITQVSC